MPNDYENPKYTNKNEYHAGDGPFQFRGGPLSLRLWCGGRWVWCLSA